MDRNPQMKIIAHIRTDFSEKFGIPRQSGLAESLKGRIIFEPEYRDINALRGLEGFSHIWLIWQFSQAIRDGWSPMVHPPRLGGNTLMGVFATRSPYRPNAIGLSSVRLERIETGLPDGPVLLVSGADMLDGTPIYDIKPYLPYTDSHPEAESGFSVPFSGDVLTVEIPEKWLAWIPADRREALAEVLRQDPRPSYQDDPDRRYGVAFAGFDVRFHVRGRILTVCEVVKLKGETK